VAVSPAWLARLWLGTTHPKKHLEMNSQLASVLDNFAATDNATRKEAEASLDSQLQQQPAQLLYALANMIRNASDAVRPCQLCSPVYSIAVWPPSFYVAWQSNLIHNMMITHIGVLWEKMQEPSANTNCWRHWQWNATCRSVARWPTPLLN